jgi:hypothetical protein
MSAEEIRHRLWDEYQVDVPIHEWQGWLLLRVSIQTYNSSRTWNGCSTAYPKCSSGEQAPMHRSPICQTRKQGNQIRRRLRSRRAWLNSMAKRPVVGIMVMRVCRSPAVVTYCGR